MIKGWRNNPQWCAFYEARNARRTQLLMQRAQMEHMQEVMKFHASVENTIPPLDYVHETQRAD